MSRKYKFRDNEGIYFVSTAVVGWIDVFTRTEYKDILLGSFDYCCKHKGLIIYAYVIMSNHFHLLISKKEEAETFPNIIRDFKKYSAMQIIKSIKDNLQESRKEWMLAYFLKSGRENSQNVMYQFWQQHNQPTEISAKNKTENAINYIHQNPVKAGWVTEPEDYLYSSARNYCKRENRLKITSLYDGNII